MKPFTFSLFLPGAKFLQDKIILKNPNITLFFTTVLKEIGIFFYNSLLRTRFNPFPLPDSNSMQLQRVVLQRERKISTSEVVFKTMSPFLVRLHHPESNKDEYLLSDDECFENQFRTITRTLFRELTGKEEEIDIYPVKLEKIPVRHYGILVESQKGILKLAGKPEALNFLYQVGIGSRRSEGFGMLEILG